MACTLCSTSLEHPLLLKRGKAVAVSLANPRLVSGHLVVYPLQHVTNITDLAWESRAELFEMALEFQDKIMSRLAMGCDLRMSSLSMPGVRRSTDHVHVYLYPRNINDELFCRAQVYALALSQDLSIDEQVTVPKLLIGYYPLAYLRDIHYYGRNGSCANTFKRIVNL